MQDAHRAHSAHKRAARQRRTGRADAPQALPPTATDGARPAHLLAWLEQRAVQPRACGVHRVPPAAVVEAVHGLGPHRVPRLHEALDVAVPAVRLPPAAGRIAGQQAARWPLHVPVECKQLHGKGGAAGGSRRAHSGVSCSAREGAPAAALPWRRPSARCGSGHGASIALTSHPAQPGRTCQCRPSPPCCS